MSSERTGYALGTLSPVIYFENAQGRIVLAGYDAGKPEQARKVFKLRFEPMGYQWREAGTLAAVDELQTRLADQLQRERAPGLERMLQNRAAVEAHIASNLRQKMISSSTSPWEREFIQLYLERRENRTEKFRQQFEHRAMYLNIRENSDSKKEITDFAPDQPGDFWRTEAQQRG